MLNWIPLSLTIPRAALVADAAPRAGESYAAPTPIGAPESAELTAADEFAQRPFTFEARLGLGAPTGFAGVAASYSPLPVVGLECGAGTNGQGLQLAAAARGRLVLGSREAFLHGNWLRAVTLTSGFARGRYNGTAWNDRLPADGPAAADLRYAAAYWWNTDFGVEWRNRAFVARVFLGLAVLLNPRDYAVVKSSSDDFVGQPSTRLVYFGFGIGMAP